MKTRWNAIIAIAGILQFLFVACQGSRTYPGIKTEESVTTTASGLRYIEIIPGAGEQPNAGDRVTVHYTGFLMDSTKFDSSVDRGEPLTFVLGYGQVIKGWDEGVSTMKIGGTRKLIIPAHLAYGDRGIGGVIPPNADLVFDVQLLRVER
jgi:FKBP-type peptidyl-prolyl cis-trans isomerase